MSAPSGLEQCVRLPTSRLHFTLLTDALFLSPPFLHSISHCIHRNGLSRRHVRHQDRSRSAHIRRRPRYDILGYCRRLRRRYVLFISQYLVIISSILHFFNSFISFFTLGEEILGTWFTSTGRRSEIFLATKFGGRDPTGTYAPPNTPISFPSYITHALSRSLQRLNTTYIDLYYQHRVDPSIPIEVVLNTLRPYVESGVIRWLGLSECSAETLRRAKAVEGVGERLVCVQDEFSPFSLEVEREGFAGVCEELGVGIVAYSPLGRGMMSGR